ncbi:MAG: preprotein translocase subunit SecE [Clostridiales bacterium]|nr:preprotein translocase subunit SecE [Clostridiales bacterium]
MKNKSHKKKNKKKFQKIIEPKNIKKTEKNITEKSIKEKKTKNLPIAKRKRVSVVQWGRELKSELKNIVWPSFSKLRKDTAVVFICIFIFGSFIWILDWSFLKIISLVLENAKS